ncbi:MAG: periplasmic heavy metal sensor [Parvibaculum sp.]|nr:periplasmic heavy metal sensor [Parvibaculum sp.]
MSETPETSPAKTPRRWLGPALLGSMALNLFLIALMAVPLVMGPPDGKRPGSPGMSGMFHSLKDLPREDREAIRQAMRGHFPAIRPHLRDMGAARTALADALAADPYDEVAARAAFDTMDEAMREMTAVTRDAMLAGFVKLTPEQRERMAQALRDGGERHKLRWRERREEGRGEPRD